MRKILIGVLSVAGLLATVLALASSSATAQMVVAFQTDTQPGTYSVSWSTRGGCDPSRPNANTTLATDGATGTRSGTVSVPPAGPRGQRSLLTKFEGSAVEFSVAVAQHCTYDYSVSFTSSVGGSKGIRCAVGYTIGDDGTGEPAERDGTRDGVLMFTEVPGTFADEIVLAVEDGDGTAGNAICNTVASVSVSIPRPTAINADGDRVPFQPHSGAILSTTFTVNANAVKDSNDECETVSEDTETKDVLDDNNGLGSTDDDTVGASLTVVETPLSDPTAVCEYEVSADLPGGFVPLGRTGHLSDLESYALLPATKFVADDGDGRDENAFADEVSTTTADCGRTVVRLVGDDNLLGGDDANADTDAIVSGDRCVVLNVRVALRSIYVLQNVVGDSGGANARYSLTLDKECAIPHDLPHNLEANRVGGIQTTAKVTVVELREGFHNISAAVMGRMVTDVDDYERTYAPRFALNKDGEACSFTAKVTALPGNCDAAEDSISANAVTGSDSRGRVIVTFDIGCSDDTGADEADDDDADDAMGAMDDDDDDAMDDDADAMGPPEDVATG